MNKAQLVDVVQKELGKEFSKAAAERSLDAVLRSIRRGV
jgi:nucleoid DNA-binding protein